MERQRMKRAAVACLAIGGLLLAGCSSNVAGSATAGETLQTPSTTSSAGPSPTPSSEPDVTTSSALATPTSQSSQTDTADGSATGTSETGTARPSGTIDTASSTWIQAFCGGFAEIASYTSPSTAGMSRDQTIAAVVAAYRNIAKSAAGSADKLNGLQSPTFPGGIDMATAIPKWFTGMSLVYGDGADTIEQGSISDPDELKTAIAAVEAKAAPVTTELSTALGEVSNEADSAIVNEPACSALVAGH